MLVFAGILALCQVTFGGVLYHSPIVYQQARPERCEPLEAPMVLLSEPACVSPSMAKNMGVVPLVAVDQQSLSVLRVWQFEPNQEGHALRAFRLDLRSPLLVPSLRGVVRFPTHVMVGSNSVPHPVRAILAPVPTGTIVSPQSPVSVSVLYALPVDPFPTSNDLQQTSQQQAVIHLAQISGHSPSSPTGGATASPPINPSPVSSQQLQSHHQQQQISQQQPSQQASQQQQPQPIQSPVSPPSQNLQQSQQQNAVGQYRPDNRFIGQSPFQSQSYVSQQAFTQPAAFATQAQYAPQQTTYVPQQQVISRGGSPYGTQTGLNSGSSYNLQEPCNRLGVRPPPLQYPIQTSSPQQHPLGPPQPAQAAQTHIDPNTGGAFFVTVLDFPDAEATPEALYYQPEDMDSELANRHPPLMFVDDAAAVEDNDSSVQLIYPANNLLYSTSRQHDILTRRRPFPIKADRPTPIPMRKTPILVSGKEAVSPAGIVQSTQPIPNVSVFVNSKESPLLQSLRDEAERNRQRLRNRNRHRLVTGGAGANLATGALDSENPIPGDLRYVDDVRDSVSVVAGPEPRDST